MAGDPTGLAYLGHTSSPLHRLDPASKMVWLACVIAVSMTPNLLHLAVLSAVVLLVSLVGTGTSLSRARKPIQLIIIIWGPFVLIPPFAFFLQGDLIGLGASDIAVLQVLGLAVPYSQSGLQLGIITFLRGFVAAMACMTVVWTTHPRDLVHSLTESARLPYKLAWAIFLAIVYTPLILHEYEVITHARAVRGLRSRPGPLGMLDTVRHTFFPLLIRGLRKGSVTALAMDSRGFGAYPTRVFRTELPRSAFDGALFWGSLLVATSYIVWLVATR